MAGRRLRSISGNALFWRGLVPEAGKVSIQNQCLRKEPGFFEGRVSGTRSSGIGSLSHPIRTAGRAEGRPLSKSCESMPEFSWKAEKPDCGPCQGIPALWRPLSTVCPVYRMNSGKSSQKTVGSRQIRQPATGLNRKRLLANLGPR